MMNINTWIIQGETGTSSKTMWAAITGAVTGGRMGSDLSIPHDPSDFRRCYLFVKECGITDEQLQKVKTVLPWWSPFIDNWKELCGLLEEEAKNKNREAPKLYERMQELADEARVLDGFVQTGPRSWHRK